MPTTQTGAEREETPYKVTGLYISSTRIPTGILTKDNKIVEAVFGAVDGHDPGFPGLVQLFEDSRNRDDAIEQIRRRDPKFLRDLGIEYTVIGF